MYNDQATNAIFSVYYKYGSKEININLKENSSQWYLLETSEIIVKALCSGAIHRTKYIISDKSDRYNLSFSEVSIRGI